MAVMARCAGLYLVSWLLVCWSTSTVAKGDSGQGERGPGSVVLVTHMTPEVASGYGRHTRLINERYAERHGYRFVVDTEDHVQGMRDARWNKVTDCLVALRHHIQDIDKVTHHRAKRKRRNAQKKKAAHTLGIRLLMVAHG